MSREIRCDVANFQAGSDGIPENRDRKLSRFSIAMADARLIWTREFPPFHPRIGCSYASAAVDALAPIAGDVGGDLYGFPGGVSAVYFLGNRLFFQIIQGATFS